MQKFNNQHRGFTLLEALVTVALVSILIGVGLPSLTSMVQDNALVTETNHLIGDINQARSEALKTGGRVIMCRSANANSAAPTCGGTATVWTTGWLVFQDADGDTDYDTGVDTLVKVGSVSGGVTVRANTVADTLIFAGNGALAEASVARFSVCDTRGVSNGREVDVSLVGRPFIRTVPSPICSCTAPPNDPLDLLGC